MSGFAALSSGDLRRQVGGRLRPGNDLDDVPRGARRLVGGLERPRLNLAEQVVGVQEDDPLRRDPGLLEDLPHELHRPLAEHRARREVAVDVLDLLLPLLHRLGDVGRDGVGRRDVDDERDAALLGDRDDRIRVPGAERAHEELSAAVDEPLGFLPRHLGLRLGVSEQELELRAAERLDAPRLVDGLGRQLGAEPAGLPRLGERSRDRVDHAELDRWRLRSQDRREPEGGQPRRGPRPRHERPPADHVRLAHRRLLAPATGGPGARAR